MPAAHQQHVARHISGIYDVFESLMTIAMAHVFGVGGLLALETNKLGTPDFNNGVRQVRPSAKPSSYRQDEQHLRELPVMHVCCAHVSPSEEVQRAGCGGSCVTFIANVHGGSFLDIQARPFEFDPKPNARSCEGAHHGRAMI